MATASLSVFGYVLPILAFLLVFIVVFAILKKTAILGGGGFAELFISFILASFFIVQAQLVEFVRVSSAWITALILVVFFFVMIVAFMPWEKPFEFLSSSNWFLWVIVVLIVVIFIFSSSYVFNWAVNWDSVKGSDWFGFLLLIVIGF